MAVLGLFMTTSGAGVCVSGPSRAEEELEPPRSALDIATPEEVGVESGIFSGALDSVPDAERTTVVPSKAAITWKPYAGERDKLTTKFIMGATFVEQDGEQAVLPNNPILGIGYTRSFDVGLDLKFGYTAVAPIARSRGRLAKDGYGAVGAMHGYWLTAAWAPDRLPMPVDAGLTFKLGSTKLDATTVFNAAPRVAEGPASDVATSWSQKVGFRQSISLVTLGLHGLGNWSISGKAYRFAVAPSLSAKTGMVTIGARSVLPIAAPTGPFYAPGRAWGAFLNLGVDVPDPEPRSQLARR